MSINRAAAQRLLDLIESAYFPPAPKKTRDSGMVSPAAEHNRLTMVTDTANALVHGLGLIRRGEPIHLDAVEFLWVPRRYQDPHAGWRLLVEAGLVPAAELDAALARATHAANREEQLA